MNVTGTIGNHGATAGVEVGRRRGARPLDAAHLQRDATNCSQSHRRERVDNTLQTTALAHEAFVRLVRGDHGGWQDRAHLLAVCAHVMRGILVDGARARRAVKRRGAEGVNSAIARNLDEIADLRRTVAANLSRSTKC